MSQPDRSPPLTEEEWIILLDLYLRRRGEAITASDPAVIEASGLLNTLGEQTGRKAGPNFRQPDGIRRELGVFRCLDPLYEGPEQKKAKAAAAVWKLFAEAPEECQPTAQAIRNGILIAKHKGDGER